MQKPFSINEFVQKISFILGENKKEIVYNKCDVSIYHLEEFSNKNHEDFIENMYQIALQRSSDSSGKSSKIDELENGKSRRDILFEMIYCEEGESHKNKYHFLGLRNIEPVTISFLNKREYNQSEFETLTRLLSYKFSRYNFSNTVLDLLYYSGTEFVFLAYRLFLKREPDFEGFHTYLANSSFLDDKLNIILDLAHSQESKDKRVEVVDLQGNLISSITSKDKIEYIKISDKIYHQLVHKYLQYTNVNHFSIFLDGSAVEHLCCISNQSNNPLETFEYVANLIFNKQKSISSYFYDEHFFNNRKEQSLILDFFNKPHTDNHSLINDYLPNNNFYISWKLNKDLELINQFNNILLKEYVDKEMGDLVSFMKKFAMEDDLKHTFNNQLSLLNDMKYIEKMIIEHEETLLNLAQTSITKINKNKGRRK